MATPQKPTGKPADRVALLQQAVDNAARVQQAAKAASAALKKPAPAPPGPTPPATR